MEKGVSASTEEYIEWIYRISKEEDRVTTTAVARRMGVSPASVTNMLKRLAERELILYQPYRGINLTETGRQLAARIIRRHGLLERLLCDVLAFPWHTVDDAVRHLGYYITDEVEERLAGYLGHPTTCPHGQPIDWESAPAAVRLSTLQPGQTATVARIGDESPEFLQYVQSRGLLPGVRVTVADREPFEGPLIVSIGAERHSLGAGVTQNVWVTSASIEGSAPDR